MGTLPKYVTDENTGLKFELVGDYYFLAGDKIDIGVLGQYHFHFNQKNEQP